MRKYKSLVVVGSSGAGKTTLVNGLRTPEYREKVVVPDRFITRPERLNDDTGENTHLGEKDFEQGVKDGQISPSWKRELDENRFVNYGFGTVSEDEDRLRVYSANNAFLRDRNPSVERILDSGLVVMVMAPFEIRGNRLKERSPDMPLNERVARMADIGDDILRIDGLSRELIDTTELSPEEGQAAMRQLVDGVIDQV